MHDHRLEKREEPTSRRMQPSRVLRRKKFKIQPSRTRRSAAMIKTVNRIGDRLSARAHAIGLKRFTVSDTFSRGTHALLHLQRHYGNRYVQRVLAMRRTAAAGAEVHSDVEEAIQGSRGGGQQLDNGVRAHMESSFGADFSGVRVHTGAKADALNQSLNARAFTTGQDIFFRQGNYDPGSSSGRELLAHELTHVVQQNKDEIQPKLSVGQPGDRYEQEADSVARAVIQKEQEVSLQEQDKTGIRRQPDEEEEESLQMQPLEEEEESVQMQPLEEEEEELQTRLQRQEEEEEEIQAKT